MKKSILSAIVLCVMLASVFHSSASVIKTESNTFLKNINEKKTVTFKVYGNCGMCEKKIEGALKGVKGIEMADWNKETKMMEVVYFTNDITLDEIKLKIAGVGYDTEEHRATDKDYNNLAGCCQYERPEKKSENKKENTHKNHNH